VNVHVETVNYEMSLTVKSEMKESSYNSTNTMHTLVAAAPN